MRSSRKHTSKGGEEKVEKKVCHEFEKNIRILAEILLHCCQLGGREYHINLNMREEPAYCRIKTPIPAIDQKCEHLRQMLMLPRRADMEQNYWQLCGNGGQLELTGMMLDYAEVKTVGSSIHIVLKRHQTVG